MEAPHSIAREHYSNIEVKREIAEFCRGRWVAVHCTDEGGGLIFRRYLAERPMVIDGEDLQTLFERLAKAEIHLRDGQ